MSRSFSLQASVNCRVSLMSKVTLSAALNWKRSIRSSAAVSGQQLSAVNKLEKQFNVIFCIFFGSEVSLPSGRISQDIVLLCFFLFPKPKKKAGWTSVSLMYRDRTRAPSALCSTHVTVCAFSPVKPQWQSCWSQPPKIIQWFQYNPKAVLILTENYNLV